MKHILHGVLRNIFRARNAVIALLVILAIGLCLSIAIHNRIRERRKPVLKDFGPVASAVRDLSGARTRVVWLQDTCDGTDYLARGVNLRLMGLDTDDGYGERVILDASRNIAKPMFTVDGDRIVFSDRHEGTMHIIDWDGGEPVTLGEGFALHTWREPRAGKEWIYYARGFVDEGEILPKYKAMYRRVLPRRRHNGFLKPILNLFRADSGREELVWNQTFISEDNYMLSADGNFASAPFPWPQMGVHDVRAQRWYRHGRGCWSGISPDNSYLFAIFDGPHRNLIMERIGGTDHRRWSVRINELPETDLYEVYHPRWSNNPWIITVSGPYKVGEGSYRLAGGGVDVEIYLGRFSDDYRAVEHWVRATYNNRANFYPDVWIELPPDMEYHHPPEYAAPSMHEPLEWPSDRNGLVYLFEHGAGQNEIIDPETGRQRIFFPEPRGRARYDHRHAMWPVKGWFVDKNPPAPGSEFSIECMLNMPAVSSKSDSLIIGYGPDFGLFLENGFLVFRWNESVFPLCEAVDEAHIVVTANGERLRWYLNGELQSDEPLPVSKKTPSGNTLYFGGHPETCANWSGALSYIAFYDRALDPREPPVNHQLVRKSMGRYPAPDLVAMRARVLEKSVIPTPEEILPYRRALVVNKYQVLEGPLADKHILAAHWAVMDGRVLDSAVRKEGTDHTLLAELFDNRPELEGERVAMDTEDITLDLYYDISDTP